MPSGSLKHCSSRRTKNQPQLSLHSFPKSNVLRGKWLKAIGEENINTRHKELLLCSLHFDESQLNRTLKIVRLCDNAVPTLFLRYLLLYRQHQYIICENFNCLAITVHEWVERAALNCRAYNGKSGSCGCGCPPPGGCPSGGPAATPTPCAVRGGAPGGGRKPPVPQDCRPTRIPYNPCCPKFHEGHDTWKKFKYFALFLLLPVIAAHTFNCLGHCPPAKGECRDYEFMRIRSKRFPWGDGTKSLFHNDHVNHLPGECTNAPLDCD